MNHSTGFRFARTLVAAFTLAGGFGLAHAADTDLLKNEVRLGAYYVHYSATANDVSGPYTPSGINLRVADLTTPYFAYLRHLDDQWVVELAAGIPPVTHTYGKGPATVGSVPFDGQEVATARWFSPSVLLEYKFLDPSSTWRPYAGLGVNYTYFYERNSTAAGDAANGGPTRISLSRSIGPACTVGVTYRFNRNVQAAASYSLARVNSHYSSDTSGVIRTTDIHFNPQALVLSVGYAF